MAIETDIKGLFSQIAGRYEFMNHLLSFGLDIYWRWRLCRHVAALKPRNVADFATGSGELAFALKSHLGREANISGFDFCPEMLAKAQEKNRQFSDGAPIRFFQADCMDLERAPGAPFDAATIAFGVRNFPDRQKGFCEFYKTLRPGGSLFVLEFSQSYKWVRPFSNFYLRHAVPFLGKLFTGKREAYRHLCDSILAFPDIEALSGELRKAGFSAVRVWRLSGGIVAIHQAIRD